MSSSPSTPPSGGTTTTGVSTYDPFFLTQKSTNLLASSSPALAPTTPLLENLEVAILKDPLTSANAAGIATAPDKKTRDQIEKALVKQLRDSDYSKWVFQEEKRKYLREQFKVRTESDEVRAKMGVAYKKWSITG